MAIPRGNASIICVASYHVWDLPSVIICDDVAKDPSDRLSLLTSVKSYISESRYLARYFPANIPWPMTGGGVQQLVANQRGEALELSFHRIGWVFRHSSSRGFGTLPPTYYVTVGTWIGLAVEGGSRRGQTSVVTSIA